MTAVSKPKSKAPNAATSALRTTVGVSRTAGSGCILSSGMDEEFIERQFGHSGVRLWEYSKRSRDSDQSQCVLEQITIKNRPDCANSMARAGHGTVGSLTSESFPVSRSVQVLHCSY